MKSSLPGVGPRDPNPPRMAGVGGDLEEEPKPIKKRRLGVMGSEKKGSEGRKDPEGNELHPPLLTECEEDKDVRSSVRDVSPEVLAVAELLLMMKRAVVDARTLEKLWETVRRARVENLQKMMGKSTKPFTKTLRGSDVDDNQARLIITKENAEGRVFPLLKADESPKKGVGVTVYNSSGTEFPMVFKMWGDSVHILTSGWKKFVHANGLKAMCGEEITLQAFRDATTGRLCFHVYPSPPPKEHSG